MKSESYWAGRMDTLNEALLGKGEAYIATMHTEYGKAMASIQRDIDAFYHRFASNNRVDLATAQQMLKAGELREFKWSVDDYIKAGRENAVDQRWMKELENASIRVRMSRLESLQMQMRQQVELLAAKRQIGARNLFDGMYKDGYYRSIFELQQGAGVGHSFAKLDSDQIDKLLAKPWAPDGSNFSARIWADRTKLVSELNTVLTQGLIRGDSSEIMISQLQERMGVSRSAAARLVLTESAYFSGQSRLDAYRELGVDSYKYTATLDNRTSAVCQRMDGQVIPVASAQAGVNYPPLHAHCRSTTIPYYEHNVKERAARDEDGKTYDVPGDMTYADWLKEHGPKEEPAVKTEPEPVKPVEPPTVKTAEPGLSSGRDDGRRSGDYAPEPEQWYDESGETAPLLVNPKDLPLPDLQPDLPRKLGHVDADEIDGYLDDAEKAIVKQAEEHAVVVTDAGEVFHVSGGRADVQPDLIGADKLRGARVTHNHPTYAGEPGGSFSKDDITFFMRNALRELRAVDSTYRYRLWLSKATTIAPDALAALIYQAIQNAEEKLTIEIAMRGYDLKHLAMVELAILIKEMQYERTDFDAGNW